MRTRVFGCNTRENFRSRSPLRVQFERLREHVDGQEFVDQFIELGWGEIANGGPNGAAVDAEHRHDGFGCGQKAERRQDLDHLGGVKLRRTRILDIAGVVGAHQFQEVAAGEIIRRADGPAHPQAKTSKECLVEAVKNVEGSLFKGDAPL